MAPKQRSVKFATVLLPLLCFAVERRVKNTSAYLNRILPYRKTSALQVKCSITNHGCTPSVDLHVPQARNPVPQEVCALFNFNFRACGLDLFLDLVRLFLCHAFLNGLGRPLNERFGIRQPQSGHSAANLFNHSNLVRAHFL